MKPKVKLYPDELIALIKIKDDLVREYETFSAGGPKGFVRGLEDAFNWTVPTLSNCKNIIEYLIQHLRLLDSKFYHENFDLYLARVEAIKESIPELS